MKVNAKVQVRNNWNTKIKLVLASSLFAFSTFSFAQSQSNPSVSPALLDTIQKEFASSDEFDASQEIRFLPLEQFTGDESHCRWLDRVESGVCLEDNVAFVDSSLIYNQDHELKIGGSIGKVIGKVTNPIRDAVTAPLANSAALAANPAVASCLTNTVVGMGAGLACAAAIYTAEVPLAAITCGLTVDQVMKARKNCGL